MDYPLTAVILRIPSFGTPHLETLQAANPGLEVFIQDCPEPEPCPRDNLEDWRNGDRNIRAFWQARGGEVTTDLVLFLEADVWCGTDLRESVPVPPSVGLMAAQVYSVPRGVRVPGSSFSEVVRLPRDMQAGARVVMPLGVLLMGRAALDAICAPEWDALFAEDIFSELRLPSLVFHLGFRVVPAAWPKVDTCPKAPNACAAGLWHPVKNPVPSVP